jgi:hypothetical protein
VLAWTNSVSGSTARKSIFPLGVRATAGFDPTNRHVANVDYAFGRTPKESISIKQQALLAQAASLPGVTRTALASVVPCNFEQNYWPIFPADSSVSSAARRAAYTVVSPGYFEKLGIRLSAVGIFLRQRLLPTDPWWRSSMKDSRARRSAISTRWGTTSPRVWAAMTTADLIAS